MSEESPAEQPKDEVSLEQAVERLEEIVGQLESGDVDLEKSITLFQEGKKLGTQALRRLDNLERRVRLVIGTEGEELLTKDFDERPE